MRKFFFFAFLLHSTFSMGQSMLVFNSGKVLTIDKQGLIYDLGHFILPYEIKSMGGRYLIDNDRKLRTLDRSGIVYSKENEDKVSSGIEVQGDNYFISKQGTLFTIDENGFFYEIKKEREYRKVKYRGGNFFVAEKREKGKKSLALFVIGHLGQVIEAKVNGLNVDMISFAGGSYFTTAAGELFTVSSEGYVYSKKDFGKFNGWKIKKGFNYFIHNTTIFTVSSTGILNDAGSVLAFGTIKHLGTNFFVNNANSLFTVSDTGVIQEVFIEEKTSNISYMSHL